MKRFFAKSKYVKHRDNTWIQRRKRIYLYWFKFLRHAEESADHKVQWNKYRAWGGKEAVMNTKFDAWWEEHWKDCFGIDEKTGRCKHHIDKNPKADGIRYALLVYENLHRGSTLDIAIAINKKESSGRGIFTNIAEASEDLKELAKMKVRGMTRKRVADDSNWKTGHRIALQDNTVMDDDYYLNKGDESVMKRETKKKVQAMIRRYKKQAKLHLENVSKGEF